MRAASVISTILDSRELDLPSPPRAASDPALASRAASIARQAHQAPAG